MRTSETGCDQALIADRRASADTPTRRRALGPLQRLFGTEPDIISPSLTRSRFARRPSAGSLYGLIRLGSEAEEEEAEWDFMCQGESPVVPTRTSLAILDVEDCGQTYWIGEVKLPSPSDRKLGSSSPPETRRRGGRGAKVSIEKISSPILSSFQHRGHGGSVPLPMTFPLLPSCLEASE